MRIKTPPSAAEVQARLQSLSHAQVKKLSELSGVPFTTLWKVKTGDTTNPGIETVRKFILHVGEARRGCRP